MKKVFRRLVPFIGAGLIAVAMIAPASAHVLVVDAPGHEEPKVGWTGGPALPAEGNGLIKGGPTGEDNITPAHAKGLNNACETIRENGNSTVDIFGPPTPAGCEHGT